MKAYLIGDKKNQASVRAANRCAKSIKDTNSDIELLFFQQTSPDTLEKDIAPFPGLAWNYPLNTATRVDEKTGMKLQGYRTNSLAKVLSCLISHARLWLRCYQTKQELMILEHDAIFTRQYKEPSVWSGGILGLNDPRGATFNSALYHQKVSAVEGISEIPWVDDEKARPQGLAGNSAYIIRPFAAKALLEKMKEVGGWPNDALMCKQHFDFIKVVYPYYTTVQGLKSTTTY